MCDWVHGGISKPGVWSPESPVVTDTPAFTALTAFQISRASSHHRHSSIDSSSRFCTLWLHFAWYTFGTLFWYIYYAFVVHFWYTFTASFGTLLVHFLYINGTLCFKYFYYTFMQHVLHCLRYVKTVQKMYWKCTRNVSKKYTKVYQECSTKV